MPCSICGKNSCTLSFHSLEEQIKHEVDGEKYIERMKKVLNRQIQRLPDVCENESFCGVNLDDVLSLIDSYSE